MLPDGTEASNYYDPCSFHVDSTIATVAWWHLEKIYINPTSCFIAVVLCYSVKGYVQRDWAEVGIPRHLVHVNWMNEQGYNHLIFLLSGLRYKVNYFKVCSAPHYSLPRLPPKAIMVEMLLHHPRSMSIIIIL